MSMLADYYRAEIDLRHATPTHHAPRHTHDLIRRLIHR